MVPLKLHIYIVYIVYNIPSFNISSIYIKNTRGGAQTRTHVKVHSKFDSNSLGMSVYVPRSVLFTF